MDRFRGKRIRTKRGSMQLKRETMRGIYSLAASAEACPESDDLNRLTGDLGVMCAYGEGLERCRVGKLPLEKGEVRILGFARKLVTGGEWKPDEGELMAKTEAFDATHGLEMAEMMHLPSALGIALCEAWLNAGREILRQGRLRRQAEQWISGARRKTADAAVFWAHALARAAENEDSDLRGRIERRLERTGRKADWEMEQARRESGENCLRMENLAALRRMLGGMDWKAFFERISPAEAELREDGIYAGMDEESQAAVREAAAQLARRLGMEEARLIRTALDLSCKGERTVCYYLCTDEGRRELARETGKKLRIKRCIPDAGGKKTVIVLTALTLALAAAFILAVDRLWMGIFALPLAWDAAMALVGRVYPYFVKPRRLLRMEIDRVADDARTLVVLPVLLSSRRRAEEMLARMEALGCLEKDENIDYLLLGDFRDDANHAAADDGEIVAAVREGVAAMNGRAERKKYYYLHRGRSFREIDGCWMGRNRKRGALTALNRLLLGYAESSFDAEDGDAAALAGKYHYAVTLDADTEYLPGTLQKLIGAMEHPLNRNYAVLQPCMRLTASACKNAYVQTLYADGGMDGYPVSVSDFYQDVCGRGCFAGKGIYRIEHFHRATEDKLPEEKILSHDLIEGILAGAGFINDVQFYDGCPDKLGAELSRSHRWTRGDWQLLPVIFMPGIAAVDRMKMVGNLLRSLYAPALLGLLINGLWTDAPYAFALGLVLAFLEALLHPWERSSWKRALLELSLLPVRAKYMLDAVLRTLWRLGVSRKHLMEWVPAADESGKEQNLRLYGRIAALLLLPGLLMPFWVPAALALGGLFFIGVDWAGDLQAQEPGKPAPLSREEREMLGELATATWHFFAEYVPAEGSGLPPDNVQMDPPAGIAPRTSPTNIGLYLLSCLSAKKLGLLGAQECFMRMERTVSALEKMEKWQGQLYNWYDIYSLEPLRPRYVSSVDSGNLAASLLLCAAEAEDDVFARRLRKLAEDMDFAALYDGKRELFRIGADIESGRMSQAHYDLYASESRILSYTAMMLGQIPAKHWRRLSRPGIALCGGMGMRAWSGTMFEYLMPEIFFGCGENTLGGQSAATAAAAQMEYGRRKKRPWGISESGYYAFDMHLNYQYRAFGLQELALCGDCMQDVVAPYASVLALSCAPAAAAGNIRRMTELGWRDEFGFYEAADYLHRDGQGQPRLVRSHMAHHQGMALCALCNALCGGYLSRRFMELPRARALRLLLEEKPLKKVKTGREQPLPEGKREGISMPAGRMADRARIADVHLLQGGGVSAAVRSDGAIFAWSGEVQLNRFSGDLSSEHEGMFVHLKNIRSGEKMPVGSCGKLHYGGGVVKFDGESGEIRTGMEIGISPEDGTLYQRISLENTAAREAELEITGCFAAALAERSAMRAHPVFQNLFVEAKKQGENRLFFRRKPRLEREKEQKMAYIACGGDAYSCECDLERLTGRQGSLSGGLASELSGTDGNTLNPCGAIRVKMKLAPGEKRRMHFALLFGDADAARLERCGENAAVERAMQLALTQSQAVLRFAGIDGRQYRVLQQASAFLLDAGLKKRHEAVEAVPKELLWRMGISGELPLMLMEIDDAAQLPRARQLIHAHHFYRMMGLQADLVLVNGFGNGYQQPVRSGLEEMISAGHLRDSRNVRGGVFVIDGQNTDAEGLEAVRRAAVFPLEGAEDVFGQLKRMIGGLEKPPMQRYTPMKSQKPKLPALKYFNGYGGFDGRDYVMPVGMGKMPPAAWSNILANDDFGALMTDRGGGFAWHGNSRSGRITPFANDPLHEGWGWMLYLADDEKAEYLRLLPGFRPEADYLVRFGGGRCVYSVSAGGMDAEAEFGISAEGLQMKVRLRNRSGHRRKLRLICSVNWLMGTDERDRAMLRTWSRRGACFASGAAAGIGLLAADDYGAKANEAGRIELPIETGSGGECCRRFLLGWAGDMEAAGERAKMFRRGLVSEANTKEFDDMLAKLRIETPDEAVNSLANGFLQAQVLFGRILGRTGLHQPGGAYGFRDQMQDMLPLIHYDPQRVRRHILYCAARQFSGGDVLHWWHHPCSGVRTGISDDLLFLPYVTAKYVQITGDESILRVELPFLEEIAIPEGQEDVYAQMHFSGEYASLHEHCMRAFERAFRTGAHGLCLMGSGDWNDGMNRVGAEGRGESVWLSEFMAACATEYGQIAPPEARERLWEMAEKLRGAVEESGWDGDWYLRAYLDDGRKLGGRECAECRIDVISQAWAVLAGLDEKRSRSAVDAAWEQLADEKTGVIRLLTPPFEGKTCDPGYIAAYPPGIRENGAQYTHGACWLVCALAKMNDPRGYRALKMLLPVYHSDDAAKAEIYRAEPYVMAADVYTASDHAGRGGWTWYTGSAAWMLNAILEILGYERRGDLVRLNVLAGAWSDAAVTVRYGAAEYRLRCLAEAENVTLDGERVGEAFIRMRDDGKKHAAVFPLRKNVRPKEEKI